MKNKRNILYGMIMMLAGAVNFTAQAQQKTDLRDAETKDAYTSQGPNGIVRTIKQDKKGNIWIASWDGIFKYNSHQNRKAKPFTNVTSKVSSARFFSVLEDKKGNFWFASIGSGVYYYDGKSFQNFTTKDGLASDRVGVIYEDKTGIIWFGTENAVSRYDGKSFKNFKMKEVSAVTNNDSVYVGSGLTLKATDSIYVGNRPVSKATDSVHVSYQNSIPETHWIHNDINAIIEDKTGKFWFGTRGHATIYDGKTFSAITNNGKPFTNVRSIIRDKKDNIWLGGADGLWRYDGKTFSNFSQHFVGHVYEDKKGNIWTSSDKGGNLGWVLSKYDGNTLSNKKPTVTEIVNRPMIFGILEDDNGNIWFGDFNGLHHYDGKNVTSFKKEASK